jgi:hypothetical protein
MTILCDGCLLQKAELFSHKSSVLKGLNILVCKTCIKNDFQPRWSIILSIQSEGLQPYLLNYVRHKKYVGEEIKARELLP